MSGINKPYLSQNHFLDWLNSPDQMLKRCRNNAIKLTKEQQAFCDFGHSIHAKAQLLYPDGIEPVDDRTFLTFKTQSLALLKARIPLFEPQFQYDGLAAKIDILVPIDDDSWELIEVKSAKKINKDWIAYTAFLYYVCINSGIKISKCSIMHLKGYINDSTPLDEIFDKTDITKQVKKLQGTIVDTICEMRKALK